MNGAESLIQTALAAGVEVCFANPGTSEMHLVSAIDSAPKMRAVLGLFEGVCTGAADGYGRMAHKPAMTLLHLGAGFGNGIANLHNARRARTPLVNVIGNHASWHLKYDAPLTSDIAGLAKPVSAWVRSSESPDAVASDCAEAISVASSPPGRIATLIVPSDSSWGDAAGAADPMAPQAARPVEDAAVNEAVKLLKGDGNTALLLGDAALEGHGLQAVGRIAAATGCRLIYETFVRRIERGAGRPIIERLPYFPEGALKMLEGVDALILVGSRPPVSFFGYEGLSSVLVPEGCNPFALAKPGDDIVAALEAVADALGAPANKINAAEHSVPDRPSGALNAKTAGQAVAALLPEGAILSDEAATLGGPTHFLTQTAAPHDTLYLTGGAIGQGIPVATGAAVAAPERQVLALQGDGGGMYTLQALWTQAREGLDVTNVIFSNRTYQILRVELARMGVTERGPKAEKLTDLSHPDLDWTQLGAGMGVPSTRASSAEEFYDQLERAFTEPGPHLIEAIV